MPTVVTCPHCDGQCAVEEKYLGMALKCPRCSEQFTAEGDAGDAPEFEAPKRRAPKIDRGSAAERHANRGGKESFMEKYFMLILLGVAALIILLVMVGKTGQKSPPIREQKTLEQRAEDDPEMAEKLRWEEERRRYFEKQEQTPGAKRSYKRKQEQEK
ncbi:MAG: zinc ribbon domain-containing protein [Planctomycetota bacterium]|jgi:hypothetical protein